MVRFAWTGWWLVLLVVDGPPAEAQQAAQAPPPQAADAPLVEPSSSAKAFAESGSRVRARSTSRAMTLPEPSQIAMTGCSR